MGLRNTTIGQRLAMGFGTVFLLVVVMLGINRIGEQRQTEAMNQLTNIVMLKDDAAKDVEINYVLASGAARSYIYTGQDEWLLEYTEGLTKAQDAFSRLNALPKNPEDSVLYDQVVALATRWDQLSSQGIGLRQQGKVTEAEQMIDQQMKPTRDQLLARTEDYINLQNQTRDAASTQASQTQILTEQSSAGLALLVLLFGSFAAFVTTRSISRPVQALAQASYSLAEGNFEPALNLSSEFGSVEGIKNTHDEVHILGATFSNTARRLSEWENRATARNKFLEILASSLDAERLTSEALAEIVGFTNCELGAVFLHIPEEKALKRVAAYALEGTPEIIRLGEGIPGEAAASRRVMVLKDIPDDTPFHIRFGFDQVPPKAIAALPMVVGDQLVGLILLGSLRNFSDAALGFVEMSAQQLGISLQNALVHREVAIMAEELQEKNEALEAQNEELHAQSEEIQAQNEELQHQYEEIQAQNEELQGQSEEIQFQTEELAQQNYEMALQSQRITLLQSITARLSTSLTPKDVLEDVIKGASNLLHSSKASVFLLDTSKQKFSVAANVGLDEEQRSNLWLERAHSLAGRVVDEGRTISIEDISTEPNIFFPFLAGGERVGSIIVAPLQAARETFGVVEVYFTTTHSFSDDEAELLTALASAAAVAIRNARLFTTVEQQMQLLDSVLVHIPEAVQVVDAIGQIVIANPAAYAIFGKNDPALLQAVVGEAEDLSKSGMLDEIWQPTVRAMRGETVLAQEIQYSNPETGQDGYAQVSAVPIFDAGGHVESVVTVATDVSRLKEIDLLKDEFLSVASHELKSPLTSLKGFAQVLQERIELSGIPDEYRKPLQIIDGQANKVVRLVNRLLDVSRVQMGRLELKREPVDLGELVFRQVQQAKVRDKSHELATSIDDSLSGYWDVGYLEEVVNNLLDNAIRYSPSGGEIRVSLQRVDRKALLKVSDHGIGIPKEALPNLFKRYYRGEGAKKVSAEGMGIGLYITHSIVEAHGGRIWAESEPGKGTTFYVELPIETADGKDSSEYQAEIQGLGGRINAG